MENKISGFQIGTLFRELFDWIAPIPQYPFIAVNIGDFALARGGIHEAWIVSDEAVILTDLNLEQIRRFDSAVSDGNLVLSAGPFVDNFQVLSSHGCSFSVS